MSRRGAETRTRSHSGSGGIGMLETAPGQFTLSSEQAQDSRRVGSAARGTTALRQVTLTYAGAFSLFLCSSAVEVCLSLLTV